MIGQTISHYQVVSKLGEGGMGVVYKARDTHLDRFVAIKVLPQDKMEDPERRRRFVQEAKAASALNHPNIMAIYDAGEAVPSTLYAVAGPALPFIVMELLTGRTLRDYRPQSLDEAIGITTQICLALEHAHANGIIQNKKGVGPCFV